MGALTRRSAVFLDRDGTLNVKPAAHEYVAQPDEFVWLPGAVDGVVALGRAGYVLAVVSNQRGVARGLVDIHTLRAIEERIQAELAREDVRITSFSYCIHELDSGCDCRKPKPGMLLSAAKELNLALQTSWMVGDSMSDVAAGAAAGCRTAIVGTEAPTADIAAESLGAVAAAILTADASD